MRKTRASLAALTLGLSAASALQAAELYPWRQHQLPLDFLFGNEIDGHQQTALARDGGISGYLYVSYTGVVTKDGFPVAMHANCTAGADCSVGWAIRGKPVNARLVRQPLHDVPWFWVERADIPQPGSYSHFHWRGMAMPMPYLPVDGYLLELTAMNRFCFIHHGAELATSGASCRDNGGIAINRGADVSSHLNLVTGDPSGN